MFTDSEDFAFHINLLMATSHLKLIHLCFPQQVKIKQFSPSNGEIFLHIALMHLYILVHAKFKITQNHKKKQFTKDTLQVANGHCCRAICQTLLFL